MLSNLRRFAERILGVIRPGRREAQLDDELRFHVQELAEDNVRAGMTFQEAHREAMAAMGGLEKAREEFRDAGSFRWLQDIARDLRYGLRQLLHAPAFTAVALITLTIGIGMNAAVFSVVNAVLLRPLPYHEAGRLVDFQEADEHGKPSWVSPANLVDYQAAPVFEQLAAYSPGEFAFSQSGGAVELQACNVSHNMFATLGAAPLLGSDFSPADEGEGVRAVILSFEFWQKAFAGERAILGTSISLDGKPYVVKGVMPAGFRFPYVEPAEVWAPLQLSTQRDPSFRGARYLNAVGRLKPGVSVEQARAAARLMARRIKAQAPGASNVASDVVVLGLRDRLVGDARPLLLLLTGAVGLVLLIASLNLANLFLSRTITRQKELAIRLAVGAGQSRLLRQLLTESVLLACLGGAAGLLSGAWAARALVTLVPAGFPGMHDLGLDWRVLAFTAAVSLGASLVFGLTPAIPALSIAPNQALKQGTSPARAARRNVFRSSIVVAEITLSVVLLAGAGLLVRTFLRLHSVGLGFNPDNVLVAQVSLGTESYKEEARRRDFVQQLLDKVSALPGVVSAGATSNLPLSGTNMVSRFSSPDSPLPAQTSRTYLRAVSAGYFRTMRVPLLRGRLIEERDGTGAAPVTLINAAMARQFWPGQDPLGRHIVSGFRRSVAWEIVGIVGDVKYTGLDREAIPEMFVPFAQLPMGWVRLAVQAHRDPLQLAEGVRGALRQLDAGLPLQQVQTMSRLVSESIAERRFYMLALALFAAVAVLLAAAGIYGVVSYSVTQRTHEIGVRVALGAGAREVLALVLAQALRLAALGLALGLAAAFALTRLLAALLFGVSPKDPLTFVLISLLLGVVALAAAWLPARRAAGLDPLRALRCE